MTKSRAPAAPFAVWMTIFTLVPLAVVVWFAFTDGNGSFTLENIWRIGDYAVSFVRSILIGLVSTLICLVLAYPLAFSISRSKGRVQQTMVMIIMLPMWMNFLLRTYAWMSLLENNGFINQFLALFGLGPLEMINTNGAIVLGMVYNFLPFMVLPIYNVLTKIDPNVLAAARDLGANGLQTFLRVMLPLSIPGVISGITMVFVPALTTFVISNLLGGSKILLIGNVIEQEFTQASNWNLGSGLSIVLMIFIILNMVITSIFDKEGEGQTL